MAARDLDQLHGANNINKQTALTEKGEVVNGRGDAANMHDILTGSQPDDLPQLDAQRRGGGDARPS